MVRSERKKRSGNKPARGRAPALPRRPVGAGRRRSLDVWMRLNGDDGHLKAGAVEAGKEQNGGRRLLDLRLLEQGEYWALQR